MCCHQAALSAGGDADDVDMASNLATGGIPSGAAAAAAQAAAAEGAPTSQIANAAGAAAAAALTSLGGSPTEAGVAASQGDKTHSVTGSFPLHCVLIGLLTSHALHSRASCWW